MLVNHYDEKCLPAESVITSEVMDEVIEEYQVFIDEGKLGHAFFTTSNEYSSAVVDEIEIPEGIAASLQKTAKEYIRRTGGYPNPAADNVDAENDGAYLSYGFNVLVATGALSVAILL